MLMRMAPSAATCITWCCCCCFRPTLLSISAAYHSLISRKCVHVKCISMSIITIKYVNARIKKGNNTTSYQVVGLCMISTFINMLVQQLQLFSKFAAWGVCWRTDRTPGGMAFPAAAGGGIGPDTMRSPRGTPIGASTSNSSPSSSG